MPGEAFEYSYQIRNLSFFIMLAFVIPFKPRRNSKDWDQDSCYLSSTIKSILHQTDSNFKIYVVLHDLPATIIEHPQLEYVTFPSSYAEFEHIKDGDEQLRNNSWYSRKDIEYIFDQGRKQMYGTSLAKKSGCEFVMCIDADDIVCNELVAYVHTHQQQAEIGWYVDKGFFYLTEKKVFVKQPYSMNVYNGSVYVIKSEFIPKFDPTTLKVSECNFFSFHPSVPRYIFDTYKVKLNPLPFYATIVQISNLNWWKTTGKITGTTMKGRIKYFLRRVYFTYNIKKRFIF